MLSVQDGLYARSNEHAFVKSLFSQNFSGLGQQLAAHKFAGKHLKSAFPHSKKSFFKVTVTDDNDEDEEVATGIDEYLQHCNFFAVFFGPQGYPSFKLHHLQQALFANKNQSLASLSRYVIFRVFRL